MRVISGTAKGAKLNSIESMATRPTLDRVKESLFNIIQNRLEDAIILDLFAGSGAIGIECLSRNAKEAYFCDNSYKATQMINQNLKKTKLDMKATVINGDYKKCLNQLGSKQIKFDLIYIDPPYKENIGVKATKEILLQDILHENGIIIIETDEKEREIKMEYIWTEKVCCMFDVDGHSYKGRYHIYICRGK